MDAFGDNFVNDQEVDPAAEFIAREQDQLAGLEVEIAPAAPVALNAEGNDLDNTVRLDGEDDGGSFEMINVIDQRSENANPGEYRKENVSPQPTPIREEPEKIKKWREEQKARLEEKGELLNACNNMNPRIY
ncbi:hypothetical protein QAD02_012024 [Eretmocerus hayati]|uniref:Uncharacterized protein n=1 Tax=Eretmocerus hayati TaxID=131215 RepID=A0ACC2NYF7_9HYME|nr:hypothetical protein QAD02_012024 [Eretmocerus hayati]